MALNKGTLITSTIRPNSTNDRYATALSNEIRGGHHTYDTILERDSIPYQRREWGMLVSILDTSTTYQLIDVLLDDDLLNNDNWVPFDSGSVSVITNESWLESALGIVDILPSNPSDGDRYLISNTSNSHPHNNIATWSDIIGGWVFDTPVDSQAINIIGDDDSIYKFDGNNWIKYTIGAIPIKYYISPNEEIIIPENYHYLVCGDLTVDGKITNHGRLVILRGDLIINANGELDNQEVTNIIGGGLVINNGGVRNGNSVNIIDL